jgi:hypothetical protein
MLAARRSGILAQSLRTFWRCAPDRNSQKRWLSLYQREHNSSFDTFVKADLGTGLLVSTMAGACTASLALSVWSASK